MWFLLVSLFACAYNIAHLHDMYHVCTTAKKVHNFVLHLHIFYRRILLLLCELHVLHEPHLYDWNTTAIVFFVFLSCFLCFLRLSFSLLNNLKTILFPCCCALASYTTSYKFCHGTSVLIDCDASHASMFFPTCKMFL